MSRVSTGLTVDRFEFQGVPVLLLAGDLDRNTCSKLDTWLRDLVSQGYRVVGLDLGRVHRLDARGISALVSAGERMRGIRRALRIVAASARVREVLEKHGLGFMLPAEERILSLAS